MIVVGGPPPKNQLGYPRNSSAVKYRDGLARTELNFSDAWHELPVTGRAVAWLLVFLSAIMHALHYCKSDECESDEDEPNTLY